MEPVARGALLICDMWDHHWCKTLEEGVDALAPHIADTVAAFRAAGGMIVHAPSETMSFYAEYAARTWVTELSEPAIPANRDHSDPPLPQPEPDPCPGFTQPKGPPWPWTRQHAAIGIADTDAILETGAEMYAVIDARAVEKVYVMGVHTNMCVLDRSFGIKQLVRWGIDCRLVSDLTEAAPPDYTERVIQYIREYWCEIVAAADLF